MSETSDASARDAGTILEKPANRAQARRTGPISPARTAVVSIGTIAFAELVSMLVLEIEQPPPFWPATLIDMTIMVFLILPPLYFVVYRPVTRLLEKHRLAEEALEGRKRDLEALYAVTSAATRDLDVDRLLSRVLDLLLPAFEADAGWMQVLGGGGLAGLSRFVTVRGLPESLVRSAVPELHHSCSTCRAWQVDPPPSGEAPAIVECEAQPGGALRAEGFVQHRCILLPVGERAGGVLNLLWRHPRPCRKAEASLLEVIGRQVGVALENAALFQAEQRARQQAETLRSASLAITRSLDFEAVFTALLDHLGRLVPFDRAKVMLLESGSRLRVRAVFTPSGKLDFPDRPLDSFDVEKNSAVREVLASRRSVCIDDALTRPGWGRGRPETERSWLGVPLIAAGEAIGLYTLVKAEPGFFTPERVQLVEALYAPASVAIANARLYEEVRSGREQIKSVSRKLVEGQEGERLRVARELHDEAGQLLSSLILGLRRLEHEASRPDDVLAHAQELKQIADAASESLHRLASDLRPAALDHLGLVPALGQLAARLSKLGGPVIQLETLGFDDGRLSPAIDIALYRIAQEALTNALRHSSARRVSLVVERREKAILMVIEDDGRGFDVETASRSGRLGLPGIRERAEMLGGNLLVESSPGSGTTLVVEVPHVS